MLVGQWPFEVFIRTMLCHGDSLTVSRPGVWRIVRGLHILCLQNINPSTDGLAQPFFPRLIILPANHP